MMKKIYFMPFLIIAVVFIYVPFSVSKELQFDWKLRHEKDGMKVFSGKVPGQEFEAARCVSVIDAKPEIIGEVLRDIPNYPEWMHKCKTSPILKDVSTPEHESYILYFYQETPVIADRDIVLRSSTSLDLQKKKVNIEFRSIHDFDYPSPKGVVRMKSLVGQWELEWIDREHTRVIYTLNIDLAGRVPGWMANSEIRKTVYENMRGLAGMVKQEKYIERAKNSEDRKKIELLSY